MRREHTRRLLKIWRVLERRQDRLKMRQRCRWIRIRLSNLRTKIVNRSQSCSFNQQKIWSLRSLSLVKSHKISLKFLQVEFKNVYLQSLEIYMFTTSKTKSSPPQKRMYRTANKHLVMSSAEAKIISSVPVKRTTWSRFCKPTSSHQFLWKSKATPTRTKKPPR